MNNRRTTGPLNKKPTLEIADGGEAGLIKKGEPPQRGNYSEAGCTLAWMAIVAEDFHHR